MTPCWHRWRVPHPAPRGLAPRVSGQHVDDVVAIAFDKFWQRYAVLVRGHGTSACWACSCLLRRARGDPGWKGALSDAPGSPPRTQQPSSACLNPAAGVQRSRAVDRKATSHPSDGPPCRAAARSYAMCTAAAWLLQAQPRRRCAPATLCADQAPATDVPLTCVVSSLARPTQGRGFGCRDAREAGAGRGLAPGQRRHTEVMQK